MKKFLFPVLLLFVSIFAFNCQKEISFTGGLNPGGNSSAPISATIQGRVVDENDQPANGVLIKVGTKTATTDSRGYFRITKASLDKNASLVIAEKAGYFKAYRTFQATSGANHISVKLIRKVLAGTLSSSTGGDITLSNGAKVSLPVNAVVKATGGGYSGTINVYAAYIDPTKNDIAQTVPGSFMADNKDGKRVTLASYGMLAVELESSAGEKLQIASGKTSTLTSPIPSSILASAPNSISLWYLDEQTGIWKEEGTAVKNGNSYVGDVKHFSFWNCDYGFPAVNLSMTLKDPAGIPLVHVVVRIKALINGIGLEGFGCTDSLGKVSGLVPSNQTMELDVLDDCYNSVYNQNIGPFTQNTDMGVITVTPTNGASLITIKGRVLNCNGAPVTNGTALIYFGYWPRYESTNNNGEFAITVPRCAASPTTCDIVVVDNTAQQQATILGIPIVVPITDAGNLAACGTSALQYVNYTLDGVTFNLSSDIPGDSFNSSDSVWQNSHLVFLQGIRSQSEHIVLDFSSNGTAGTHPLGYLSVNTYNSVTLVQPFNIIITNYPTAPGDFFEGTFAGQFKDILNVTHTLSGSLKIRLQ
jgi:hypothetical protein